MKRFLLPPLCAVVLAACDGGQAQNATTTTPPPVTAAPSATPAATAETVKPSVATEAPPTAPMVAKFKVAPELPPPVQEVIRLAQTTLGENVLISYVEGISEPFKLSADQLIYLNDLGVTDPVIQSLLKRESALRTTPAAAVAKTPATQAETVAPPPPPPATPAANQPATGVSYADVPGGAVPPPPVTYGQPQPGPTVVGAPAAQPAVAVATGGTVINYNTFYESLAPYGSWVEVADYGYCWRPTVAVVSSGWQPYCHNGSWAWSDHGWYWNSGYSWGWAPFHYGRWHRHSSIGWVWQPGNDWGPAWVNWSYTGDHCAWAPLPPECHWSAGVGFNWRHRGSSVSVGFGIGSDAWIGVGWSDFCRPRVWDRRVPHARVTEIVNKGTTVVAGDKNQVVNINGNNNTVIINNGAPYEKARSASRDEIRKVAIADVAQPGAPVGRQPGGTADRPVIAAYRPRLDGAAAAQPKAPASSILSRQQEEARKTAGAPLAAASRPNLGQVPPQALGGARTEAPSRSSGIVPSTAPAVSSGSARPAPSTGTGYAAPSRGAPAPAVTSASGSTRSEAPVNRPLIGPAPRPGETYANPQIPPRPAMGRVEGTSGSPAAAPSASRASGPSANPMPVTGSRPNAGVAPASRPTPSRSTEVYQDTSRLQNPAVNPRLEERKAPRVDYGTVPGAPARVEARSSPTLNTSDGRPNYAAPAAASRPNFNAPAPSGRTDFSTPTVRSAPGYSAPAPSARSEPAPSRNYSAPAPTYATPAPNRNSPGPAQTYSAPAPSRPSSPAPTYSAPAPSRPSAPAPTFSAPAPSRSNDGNNRNKRDN